MISTAMTVSHSESAPIRAFPHCSSRTALIASNLGLIQNDRAHADATCVYTFMLGLDDVLGLVHRDSESEPLRELTILRGCLTLSFPWVEPAHMLSSPDHVVRSNLRKKWATFLRAV